MLLVLPMNILNTVFRLVSYVVLQDFLINETALIKIETLINTINTLNRSSKSRKKIDVGIFTYFPIVGIFTVGIFTVGIFTVGIFTVGIFTVGIITYIRRNTPSARSSL